MNKLHAFFEKYFEDPNNPILGPAIKLSFYLGIWRVGNNTFKRFASDFILLMLLLFYLTMLIHLGQLFISFDDMQSLIESFFITITAVITNYKIFLLIRYKEDWKILFQSIAQEEFLEKQRADLRCLEISKKHTLYIRKLFLFYFICIFLLSCSSLIPIIFLFTNEKFKEAIQNGTVPYPQNMPGWYPFDHTKPPGYFPAIIFQLIMGAYARFAVFTLDMNSFSIMIFLKIHFIILKDKCRKLFVKEGEDELTRVKVAERIKECHRHHAHLVEIRDLYNSLVSQVMFLYVVICSIVICGAVLQVSSVNIPSHKKMFPVMFAGVLVTQLLCYCWHSTLVSHESNDLDRGVYESAWWRADTRTRKDLLILGAQLNKTFEIKAGPCTVLSIDTFISIMKGTYSYYTLMASTGRV